MRVVIQRVSKASCDVDGKIISEISQGLVVFTCFEIGDNSETIEKAIYKISNLRIFEGDDGKMNHSIVDIKGELLHISQFTLSWDGRKGHRPSFERSMPAREANLKYELMTRQLSDLVSVKKGRFGADMKVNLINDGPVTILLDF